MFKSERLSMPPLDVNWVFEFQRTHRLTQRQISMMIGKHESYLTNQLSCQDPRFCPELLDLYQHPEKYADQIAALPDTTRHSTNFGNFGSLKIRQKKDIPKEKPVHINPDLSRFPVGTRIIHRTEGTFKGIVRGYLDNQLVASKPLEFYPVRYEPSLFRAATPKDECYHIQDHLISWRDIKCANSTRP